MGYSCISKKKSSGRYIGFPERWWTLRGWLVSGHHPPQHCVVRHTPAADVSPPTEITILWWGCQWRGELWLKWTYLKLWPKCESSILNFIINCCNCYFHNYDLTNQNMP
jgi:hypothetical protein